MRLISGIIFLCALFIKFLAASDVDEINCLTRRVQTAPLNSLIKSVFESTISHKSQIGLAASEVENNLKSLYFTAVSMHHPGGFADLKKVPTVLPIGDYVRAVNAISFVSSWSFPIISDEVSAKVLSLHGIAHATITDKSAHLAKVCSRSCSRYLWC